jgi:hypothetical protein
VSKNQWRKVRVVVEVPARGNLLTERSLAQSTRVAISDAGSHLHNVFRKGGVGGIGAWRVLEYARLTRVEFAGVISAGEITRLESARVDRNTVVVNQRLIAEWAFRQCEKGLNLQGMQIELEKIIAGSK